MSLQTTYLVNGDWATRRVDISEILARNREANTPTNAHPAPSPMMGMLSRTLVNGPAIQWVLPARIRHQSRNDVVFVGDNFIQIKELVPSGHLEEVITKTDFDAKIIGAKVINACPELGVEDRIGIGRESGNGSTLDSGNLAPQILVLVLSSREMVFLYARELHHGRHEFVHERRPLPADVGSLEEYDKNITVEPLSRAMALSATHKFFGIFTLKSPTEIQQEMSRGPVNPIKGDRFFRVEGDVLRMEFLYPKAHETEKAILLLLVARANGIHMVLYQWKISDGLESIGPSAVIKRRLPELAAPPILVPLIQSTSFMLITATTANIFMDVVEQALPARSYALPPRGDLEDANLVWTQWARPLRHRVRNREFDDIYLCREDGEILYLEISGCAIQRNSVIGFLGCNLDSGFAILDGGFEAGDLFVATGSTSSGGLFVADPRKPLRCVQRIPNWTPVLDSVIIEGSKQNNFAAAQPGFRKAELSNDRIFTCSGEGSRRGSITELRYGLEARIGLVVDQDDSSSIVDLWAIPNPSTGDTFCLISNPLTSSLLSIPIDAGGELYALDEDSSGLDLNAPTLAAGSTTNQVLIQITDVSVHLTVLGNQNLRCSVRLENPTERIVAATVNGKLSLIATAVRCDGEIQIVVRTADLGNGTIRCNIFAEPLSTTYEPICLTIEEVGTRFFLFIGTSEGKLLVVHIDHTQGLVPVLEQDVLSMSYHDSTACEYLQLVSTIKRGTQVLTLLCGLRGGILSLFDIQKASADTLIGLAPRAPYKLGDTGVRIRGYQTDKSAAIIACSTGIWRISFNHDEGSVDHNLDKILITNQNNPSWVQSPVDIFCCVDLQPTSPSGGLGGSILCYGDNQLYACMLEKIPKPVPREIFVPGNPKQILYSEYLRKLVVAYDFITFEKDGEHTRRYCRPRICFIDPDDQSSIPPFFESNEHCIGPPEKFEDSRIPTGASGEKITTLAEWTFNSDGHTYYFIIIGTSRQRSVYPGRLIYISVRADPQNPNLISSVVKNIHEFEQPVRAMCSYQENSLLIAVGDGIILQSLNPTTKRWRREPPFKLESIPLSISVKGSYIYVLTARHSLCILAMAENQYRLHCQDGSDREGLDHINLTGASAITMTSNRGGSIVGFSPSGELRQEKLLRPSFVLHMPHSVIHLSLSYRSKDSGSPEIVYGTTLDGTIYQFTSLKEHEWRLLRFIQNICLSDPSICPYRPRRRLTADDLSPIPRKPESMHIDGDILSRVMDKGIDFLEGVMNRNSTYSSLIRSTEDNSGRLEKFKDFAMPVVGPVGNPFPAVMSWMGNLLRIDL